MWLCRLCFSIHVFLWRSHIVHLALQIWHMVYSWLPSHFVLYLFLWLTPRRVLDSVDLYRKRYPCTTCWSVTSRCQENYLMLVWCMHILWWDSWISHHEHYTFHLQQGPMELNQILGVLGNAWLLSVFILALIFGLVVMRAKLSQSIKFLEVTKQELYMSRRIIREKVNYKRMQSLACTYSEYFSLDIWLKPYTADLFLPWNCGLFNNCCLVCKCIVSIVCI